MVFAKLRKFLLIFIGALLGICFYISISYAYYTGNISIAGSTGANIQADGDVVLIDTTAITLTGDKSAPISDAKALSSTNYRNQIQIRNDKKASASVNVYMVPVSASNMSVSAVKYVLYDSAGTKPTSGTALNSSTLTLTDAQKSLITAKGFTPTSTGYKLGTFSIATNTTKTYNLYLWVNRNETGTHNATINQRFEGVILIT